MDKYLEYLESLKKSNSELLMPSNRAMLMKSMEEKFNIKIQSEEDLVGFATDRGFSFPEKKKDVQNGDTGLDSTLDQQKSFSESQPVQDGMGFVDLSAAQKRSRYISEKRQKESLRIGDDLYKDINSDFLDRNETEVKVSLSKMLTGKGFKIKEEAPLSNKVSIQAPNGKSLDLDLNTGFIDRSMNLMSESASTSSLPFLGTSVASSVIKAGYMGKGSEKDLFLMNQSKTLRDFLNENTQNLIYNYQSEFESNPIGAVKRLKSNLFDLNTFQYYSKHDPQDKTNKYQSEISRLNKKLEENPNDEYTKKRLNEVRSELKTNTEQPKQSREIQSSDLTGINKKIREINKEISELEPSLTPSGTYLRVADISYQDKMDKLNADKKALEDMRTRNLELRNDFSNTVADLINYNGGVKAFDDPQMYSFIQEGLDIRDVKIPEIKIGGVDSSYNELYDFLTDYTLRKATVSGDISVEVSGQALEKNIFFGDLIKEAVALNERQLNNTTLNSFGSQLAGSSLEVIDNVSEALLDSQKMLTSSTFKITNKMFLGSEDYNQLAFDSMMDQMYSLKHSKLKKWSKDLKDRTIITEGDISSAESVSEFLFKGFDATAQSIPVTALYLFAPEVGLATTGLSTYGRSIQEMNTIRDYIRQTGDPTGEYNNYGDLTLTRARGIAASKALVETAFTYAFTYQFLKGLSRTPEMMAKQSMNETRNFVDSYVKSSVSKFTNLSGKSLKNELKEESLIKASNMFVDEMYGIKDYSIRDYIREIGNTALTVPFTTLPLSTVAYTKMNKASKSIVHNLLADAISDVKIKEKYDMFNALELEIESIGEDKLDQSILDERDALGKEIVAERERVVQMFKEDATPQDIVDISKNVLRIREKAKQAKTFPKGSQQRLDAEKQTIEFADKVIEIINKVDNKKIEEEIDNNPIEIVEDAKSRYEALSSSIGADLIDAGILSVDEFMDFIENEKDLDKLINGDKKPGDEGYVSINMDLAENKAKQAAIDKAKELNENFKKRVIANKAAPKGKTSYEKQARQSAAALIDKSLAKEFSDSQSKIDGLLDYLNTVTEDDMTSFQENEINQFYRTILNPETFQSALDRAYSTLADARSVIYEIQKFNPTSKKIVPVTYLESMFTGYKGAGMIGSLTEMAGINHLLSMMFKNDRMGSPIKNLSSEIDAKFSGVKNKVDAEIDAFLAGNFLDGKISKKRLENVFSDNGVNEMVILSHLAKIEEGVTPAQHFKNQKNILFSNIDQLKKLDDSDFGKQRREVYTEAYNRLFKDANSIEDVYRNADKDIVSALKKLQEVFQPIKDLVFEHMIKRHGKTPTVFENYIPSFYSLLGDNNTTPETRSDFENMVVGPMSMQETFSFDDIKDTNKVIVPDNFVAMVFRSLENLQAELALRPDLDKMRGVVNSKAFENIFDTESKKNPINEVSDFQFLRDRLNEKINLIDQSIQSVGQVQARKVSLGEDLLNVITKQVTATRLSTLSMRTSQATSAMLASAMIVGNKARGFLLESIARFMSANLTAEMESNTDAKELLSYSSTSRRSGLEQRKPSAFLDKTKKRKAVGLPRKAWDNTMDGLGKISDKTLDLSLGQSDKIAGQVSWLAFYYDRMIQTRNSEVKDMSFNEFLSWSKENVDMNAVAWADQQIDRSQMLSNNWNNGKAFSGKIISNIVFPFGRFAYNRKVGMANDWSIINDKQTATEADKAKAWRRLTSAVVEIGVFKSIQPAVGIMMTKAFAGALSSLVGFDDEYDRIINTFRSSNYLNTDDARLNQFQISNYKRDLGKEFYTSLFEGLIPAPAPSAVNEFLMAALNDTAGEELFNVYSKDIRDIFVDGDDSLTTEDLAQIISKNMGIATLALDDGIALVNAIKNETGRLPNPFGGKDRWVIPEAMDAAEILKQGRILNVFVQSADLKKFLNSTERLLQREYTVTKRPNYEAMNVPTSFGGVEESLENIQQSMSEPKEEKKVDSKNKIKEDLNKAFQ